MISEPPSTHFAWPACRKYKAFSLLELLVVIVIVAVLSTLSFGVMQKVMVRQKETLCMSNLRTLSGGMMSYIQDCNNVLKSMHGGADVRGIWVRKLLMGGYINPDCEISNAFERENPILTREIGLVGKYFRCPTGKIEASFIPYDVSPRRWLWQVYGMGMYAPEGEIYTETDKIGTTGYFKVAMAQIAAPSRYVLFADSASDEINGYQSFQITKSASHRGGIALRHQGFANAVFLDGHMERVDYKRAQELGVPKIYRLKE